MGFLLNGEMREIPADWAEESRLYLLRERFGLPWARYGCGVGMCRVCTVNMDGVAVRFRLIRARDVSGGRVRTLEGLAEGQVLHPVQRA